MDGAQLAGALQLLVALPLATALLVLVLRARLASFGARALVFMLALEAIGQGLWGFVRFASAPAALVLGSLGITAYAWSTFSYLFVLRTLDTRAVRFLDRPGALVAGALVAGVPATANLAWAAWAETYPNLLRSPFGVPGAGGFAFALVVSLAVGVFGLVGSIAALTRAAPGSAARRRARAFVVAFAARDLLFALAIAIGGVLVMRAPAHADLALPLWPLGTIAFVPLVAYGILQTQLFDIDLRLKWTIRRGTVVAIFVAVFVAASAAFQEWLGQTQGILAGALAAGLLVFVLNPLQRLADRVANKALPGVEDSPTYLAFRKLEVYKAALEGAGRDGVVTEPERAMLERLRRRLEIPASDAWSLERDVLGPAASPPEPSTAAPS